jgi:hypothetical protein
MTALFRGSGATLLLVALYAHTTAARADSGGAIGTLVPVFTIAKSENKNRVQYVIRVDDNCAPLGPAPVSAYWRMLEQGPTQTAPILPREVRAYGLANQVLVSREASGGHVRIVLKALPDRPMSIVTSRGSNGACQAVAAASIAGAPAHLFNVYVHLKWYGFDYLLLQGWSLDNSHVVRERLAK